MRLEYACSRSAIAILSVLGGVNLVYTQTQQCVPVSFPGASIGFEYGANLTQLGTCALTDFNISRIYVEGACLGSRNNRDQNPNCGQQGAAENTTAACEAVFAAGIEANYAYRDRFQDVFDSGLICRINLTTYFYVSTNCTGFSNSWIELNNVTDRADCLVDSDAYHRGAAIGIAVAAIVFLLLLIGGWAFWYMRIRRRRGMSYEPQQDINMQPYPPQGGGYQGYSSTSLPAQQTASHERIPGYTAAGTVQGTAAQGTPVYSPWTGGGFKPDR